MDILINMPFHVYLKFMTIIKFKMLTLEIKGYLFMLALMFLRCC